MAGSYKNGERRQSISIATVAVAVAVPLKAAIQHIVQPYLRIAIVLLSRRILQFMAPNM